MKSKKYKLGLTFGAFDPPHIGHLNLFENAKKLCDELIVCVSDAEYIKEHKKREEYIPYNERIRMIEAMRCVDGCDIQNKEFGKKEAVKHYKPDVLFVGSDWDSSTYGGEGLGVPVVYLKYTKGVSSTKLRDKF